MSRFIWLSFILGFNDPRPPAIPAPSLKPLYTIKKDNANVQALNVASHTGTHLDAPRHIIEEGLSITDFSPEELIYVKPAVIELRLTDRQIIMPEHLYPYSDILQEADIVLFKFGYGSVRKSDPQRYSLSCPGFGVQSAKWLRRNSKNLRAVGMDVPSFSCIAFLDQTMAAHNEVLSGENRRFLIIEDMDLASDLNGLIEVRVSPWMVEGMDSSPCSVVGIIK